MVTPMRRAKQERRRLKRAAKRRAIRLQTRVHRKGTIRIAERSMVGRLRTKRRKARSTARRRITPHERKQIAGFSVGAMLTGIGEGFLARALAKVGGWWRPEQEAA